MERKIVLRTIRDLNVAVTGGAGYVGSAVAHHLSRLGARVTVIDTLIHGNQSAVGSMPLEIVDIRDKTALVDIFRRRHTHAVCHLAALAAIPESFKNPDETMSVNLGGTVSLLEAMRIASVRTLTFASTCAIYATPADTGRPLRENDQQGPLSPYAASKRLAEQAILASDVRSMSLRFFNAAGADREAGVGENHNPETHAIPRLVRWARGHGQFAVFGTDYPTRDGTCERDYVHTDDIAWAHALAITSLLYDSDRLERVINLGSGVGTTVRELVEHVCMLMSVGARPDESPRRAGDAPTLLADTSRARDVLGWAPKHGLESILRDAIWWYDKNASLPRHGDSA